MSKDEFFFFFQEIKRDGITSSAWNSCGADDHAERSMCDEPAPRFSVYLLGPDSLDEQDQVENDGKRGDNIEHQNQGKVVEPPWTRIRFAVVIRTI